MKNVYLMLLVLYTLTSCQQSQLTHREVVTDYYKARDVSNYNDIKKVIHDSIVIVAGDYVMRYSHESFYEQFQWDSVFKPTYELIELKEQSNEIIASVSISNIRNKFLKNNAMTCDYKISFTSGKISEIEELDCKNVDWKIWATQRDSLVNWVKTHHPKLNGFVNDMTMSGAINYVKAIDLYEGVN